MNKSNLARVRIAVFTFAALFVSSATAADASPAGLWKTIDDETGKPKSHIRVAIEDGTLTGTIEKLLPPTDPNVVCEACTGALKDRPIVGMTILTGMKRGDDGYKDGQIVDPKNGKSYKALLWLDPENENKLNVRGYIGVSLFGRSQTWIRAE